MDDIGISPWTSYIFLGLSLSIGLLVYILMRDASRRKQDREERERRQAEELLKEFSEQQRKVKQATKALPDSQEAISQDPEENRNSHSP